MLPEVDTERDRLLDELHELSTEALPLREQVARLTTIGEHPAAQMKDNKTELKESRAENRMLQAELLALELGSFPRGCCELPSQTLVQYLRDHNNKLFPYVIGMEWRVVAQDYGHVIPALNGDYTGLALDQFDRYDDWIVAETIESGKQISTFLHMVRNQGGTITTRKLTFDGIPDDEGKRYDWLKDTADSLLAETGQQMPPCGTLNLVSMEISPEYRNRANTAPSDKASHTPPKRKR